MCTVMDDKPRPTQARRLQRTNQDPRWTARVARSGRVHPTAFDQGSAPTVCTTVLYSKWELWKEGEYTWVLLYFVYSTAVSSTRLRPWRPIVFRVGCLIKLSVALASFDPVVMFAQRPSRAL